MNSHYGTPFILSRKEKKHLYGFHSQIMNSCLFQTEKKGKRRVLMKNQPLNEQNEKKNEKKE